MHEAFCVRCYFHKSRDPVINDGSFAIVADDDEVGALVYTVDDGTDYVSEVARIAVHVDGTPGANDTPGRIVFATTADGAYETTERMRIDAAGDVGIGGSVIDSSTGNPRVRLGQSMIRATSTAISQAAGAAEPVGWGNHGAAFAMAFVTAVRTNTMYDRSIWQIAFAGAGSVCTVITRTGTAHAITFTSGGTAGRLHAQATNAGETFAIDVIELSLSLIHILRCRRTTLST